MTECRRCARKCELFICSTCVDNLRTQLYDLRWWLDRLMESVVGQVKLSDGGRRTSRRDVLHGDDSLASHIAKFPNENEVDLRKARRQRERIALHNALAIGRVNGRASDEYDRINNTLSTWIRDICETRGLETPKLNTATAMAWWLAKNVTAIAAQESAAECCEDIAVAIKHVERIVNRPTPPRAIGPCITDPAPDEVLEKRRDAGDYSTRCNLELTAAHKAKSVTCPQCKITHADVEAVVDQNIAEMGETNMTIRMLVDVVLPRLNEVVPQRTLEQWIKRGWLEVRGHDPAGAQMVRLNDVRDLRASRPRHKKAS